MLASTSRASAPAARGELERQKTELAASASLVLGCPGATTTSGPKKVLVAELEDLVLLRRGRTSSSARRPRDLDARYQTDLRPRGPFHRRHLVVVASDCGARVDLARSYLSVRRSTRTGRACNLSGDALHLRGSSTAPRTGGVRPPRRPTASLVPALRRWAAELWTRLRTTPRRGRQLRPHRPDGQRRHNVRASKFRPPVVASGPVARCWRLGQRTVLGLEGGQQR